ncbi:4'-phosphopantetheinyl transferase [Ligilactobacillus salitolerans]|uniref:Holo-[acyl-carrier-protein] synthase n=1 Tax=Ligilactobacillus salitolerans TaxID=1808352 RepID=A0A401IS34_9LACO|nr:holo-ACP synthase [Ligilactobacillus salitolerans]GBG94327.1 4'-phosphopantetheinyl transferase [Ligilactobacillus salitolerans]
MIIGLGVDITDLDRIRSASDKSSHFARRVLTENEMEAYQALVPRRQVEFLGGRFSAKESFSKAYGTGIGKKIGFQDIEILSDQAGKPQAVCPLLKDDVNVLVSISHTAQLVMTEVILER